MNRKIAILRGINVGGKRKILMVDLRLLCENLGWKNVESYIQSGNLIFTSSLQNSELEKMLEQTIVETFAFDVPVIIRSVEELENLIKNNPFFSDGSVIDKLHLTFLKQSPTGDVLSKIQTFTAEPDQFSIIGNDVFILCEGKYHQSKLTNNFFENKLKTGATTRNWKTVLKLFELADAK